MELRKKQEIAHYDALASAWMQNHAKAQWDTDVEKLPHNVFASYQFLYTLLTQHIKKGTKLLDYGCGNGIHAILPARLGANVVGIDLSKESLAIARKRAKREGVEKHTTFLQMDCEALSFPSGTFDIILDGGTFSSLDLSKALPELARVLTLEGKLIAIETLGHNPLFNLKRLLNRLLGKRTSWAVDHIFTLPDLALMKQYFAHVETHFFHFFSPALFPFISWPGGMFSLRFLEKIDNLVLRLPFLKRYAFKIVIIASKPKQVH